MGFKGEKPKKKGKMRRFVEIDALLFSQKTKCRKKICPSALSASSSNIYILDLVAEVVVA